MLSETQKCWWYVSDSDVNDYAPQAGAEQVKGKQYFELLPNRGSMLGICLDDKSHSVVPSLYAVLDGEVGVKVRLWSVNRTKVVNRKV